MVQVNIKVFYNWYNKYAISTINMQYLCNISRKKWTMKLIFSMLIGIKPAGIYMLKVNNRNTRARCEICWKLTIKIPERRLASFWYIYCYIWTYFTPCSSISIVNFEHVIAGWESFLQIEIIFFDGFG